MNMVITHHMKFPTNKNFNEKRDLALESYEKYNLMDAKEHHINICLQI